MKKLVPLPGLVWVVILPPASSSDFLTTSIPTPRPLMSVTAEAVDTPE